MPTTSPLRAQDLVPDAATLLLFATLRKTAACPTLSQVVCIHNGQGLKAENRDHHGAEDVFGSGGCVGKHSERMHSGPFVVIGRKGSAGKATFASRGGWVTDTAYFATPLRSDELDCKFLFYAIKSMDLSKDVITTAIPGINRTAIYAHSLPLPALPIQIAVAQFLDAVSDCSSGTGMSLPLLPPPLSNLRRIVEWIEELANRIQAARDLRTQAAKETEALLKSAINKAFTSHESQFWHKTTFGDENALQIIDGDRGKNYPAKMDFTESGYCVFLNTGNVRRGFFDFFRCDFVTSEKDSALRKGKLLRGDVVLTTRGTLGNFAHYDDTVRFEHMRINSGMVILRPKTDVLLPEYLRVVLDSPTFSEQVAAMLSGSAQSQLPINRLSRIGFLLPALAQQRQIARELAEFQAAVEQMAHLQAETSMELDALMPSILDKAFRGEL